MVRAEEQPTRFIVIRAWRGETLVAETQLPIVPGQSGTMLSGDGGPRVPEGMKPPPLKVSSMISVRVAGTEDTNHYAGKEQEEAALAKGNHFLVGDVEVRILESDADRFAAVIFDTMASQGTGVVLPAEIAFTADDEGFVPAGVITAWVSGSLVPMNDEVLIDRDPIQPSITLQKEKQ